jgi:hypothetical protein
VSVALVEVIERTARLETKVDRLVLDAADAAGLQRRIGALESWIETELAGRAARGAARGIWIAMLGTVVGGGVGAVIAHLWR